MAAPPRILIEIGQRFGRGVVIDNAVRIRRSATATNRGARLRCDCGNEYDALPGYLVKGRTVSCGCKRREAQELAAAGGVNQAAAAAASITHGLARHPLYPTWRLMLNRCENSRRAEYPHYGGRGVTVCERWHDVRVFVEDIQRELGPRPAGMTLDRINNDGSYEPGNVRWATKSEQAQNRRKARRGNVPG